jgi:coniferyl-aldehyde dehydrogenase
MGAYHGIEGFETFSHKKGTFVQSRLNGAFLLSPPYGQRINRLLKLLIG